MRRAFLVAHFNYRDVSYIHSLLARPHGAFQN